jgi:hypothetical protein
VAGGVDQLAPNWLAFWHASCDVHSRSTIGKRLDLNGVESREYKQLFSWTKRGLLCKTSPCKWSKFI